MIAFTPKPALRERNSGLGRPFDGGRQAIGVTGQGHFDQVVGNRLDQCCVRAVGGDHAAPVFHDKQAAKPSIGMAQCEDQALFGVRCFHLTPRGKDAGAGHRTGDEAIFCRCLSDTRLCFRQRGCRWKFGLILGRRTAASGKRQT